MKYALLVITSLFFFGCGRHDDSSPTASSIETVTKTDEVVESGSSDQLDWSPTLTKSRVVELKKDFSNIEDFKNNINTYVLTFTIKAGSLKGLKLYCYNKAFTRTHKDVVTTFDQEGRSARVTVHINDSDAAEITYKCDLIENGVNLETKYIILNRSYVVSGKQNYTTLIGTSPVETLLLEKDSVLTTNGKDVSLTANELISNRGKIVTFPENPMNSTGENRPGQSGGEIKLYLKSAQGLLFVELRGLSAGVRTDVPEKVSKVPERAASGVCRWDTYYRDTSICFGQDGAWGFEGVKGYPGLPGGSTGSFGIILNEDHSLKISLRYFPGLGSAGGKGGPGGDGGPGGIGSASLTKEPCSDCRSDHGDRGRGIRKFRAVSKKPEYTVHPDGAQGKRGPPGPYGTPGISGKIIESIIVIDKEYPERLMVHEDWQNFGLEEEI